MKSSASERFVGKTTILGAGYGMGGKKFQAQLKTFGVDIPEDEAITNYSNLSGYIWKDTRTMETGG